VQRHVFDGILIGREHLADLRGPMTPRFGAPEVVGPEETALEQVIPQMLSLIVAEADGAGIRGHEERTIEERGIERTYDVEVRPLILVTTHPRLRQLRQARGQIDLGVGIVGLPADTRRFSANAAIRQTTDDEGGIGHLRRRETRGVTAFAEVTLSVSHTDRR